MWVANTLDGTVSRIDPNSNAVVAVIPVGDGPGSLAIGDEGVWVGNEFDGTVMRIDPRTNTVVESIETGQRPAGLALDGAASGSPRATRPLRTGEARSAYAVDADRRDRPVRLLLDHDGST